MSDLKFYEIDREKYSRSSEKAFVFSKMEGGSGFAGYFLNRDGEANRKGLTIREAGDISDLIALLERVKGKLEVT